MKKEQKVIISNSTFEVNSYLDKGWKIVSVTPSHSQSGNYFCFVIEREAV